MEQATKTKREQYIEKLTNKLKEWDKDFEDLERKADQRMDQMKADFRKRLDDLKSRRARMKEKLGKLEQSGESAFDPIKKDLELLWKDTKDGLKRMRKELKK